ncbi:GNAT family N-acetyltransferase [Pseudonocardia sp. ICBG1293]|uniref:GNAT family N-acetyltransferase n=1 Tax=Pseudonocardia sp. ICBG1293 TaxID=2844382 RepID=UPI001CCA66D1|nr:GNAT family N-acetyltransferase [Pseudonocardia sp. ICBG1293]
MTAAGGLGGDWSVAPVRDPGGFRDLAAEWDALADRCASATPFQRSGWLCAWWDHYGDGASLHVVTVRRDGRLVAGAALMTRRLAGVRVLGPVGGGLSDITEFLVDETVRDEAVRHLARSVLAEPGWQVVELPEVRADGVAAAVAAHWRGAVSVASSVCLEVPFGSVEALLAGTEGRSRKRLRTRIRKVRATGVEYLPAGPGAAVGTSTGVATLLDLHALQWEGRGGNPEHRTPRFAAMLTGALDVLVPAGVAHLDLYRVDGVDVAAMLLLVGPRAVYAYLLGVSPALRDGGDGAALTLSRSLDVVEHRERVALDMLRGAESYKRRWQSVEIPQRRVLLSRRRSPGAASYVATVRVRAALRDRVRDRAPELHARLGATVRALRADGAGSAARTLLTRRPPGSGSSTT